MEGDRTKQQINDYSKDIESVKYKNIKGKGLKAEVEL